MNEIHPLVMATLENERARCELELERLRSAREACVTSSAGGQNRAMALGKKIQQLEEITGSWRLVLATVLDDDPRGEACPHDCDSCHDADCPCPRMGCAGDPDREDVADRIVAYRGTTEPVLHCARCVNHAWQEWTALTSEDLPDGGVCGYCHGDVLPVVAYPDGSTMRGETDAEFQKRMGLDVLGPLRVVGSKSLVAGRLRCPPCTEATRERLPRATLRNVTSEDLPDGGMCADCNADVLA